MRLALSCSVLCAVVSVAQAQSPLFCSADFDFDGDVGGADLSALLGAWNTSNPTYDLNDSGLIDGADLSTLLGQWGQVCQPFHGHVTVSYEDGFAVAESNGLPDHPTGPFDGSEGCFNPNDPGPHNDSWLLPLEPTATDNPAIVVLNQPGPIGVLVTGAAFYNAYDGGGQEAPGNICMDACEGHASPDRRYHYHQYSPCIGEVDFPDGHSGIIGLAFDGYGVYGLYDVGGMPPNDLDECGGHYDPVRGYHYHFQGQFPWTLGCYHGEPELSNFAGGGGGGGGGGGEGGCDECAARMIPPPICNCVHTTPGLEYCCDNWDAACEQRLQECGG